MHIFIAIMIGVVGFVAVLTASAIKHKTTRWLLVCVALVVMVGGFSAAIKWGFDEDAADKAEKVAAVKTLEDRYDITVNEVGFLYSNRPSDWMIDAQWRECYLTSDDITKIETTRLMCDTNGDRFAEITPTN